jgi:hypothetical protein
MTRELIVVNTATASDLPDGMLAVGHESREQLMSGVHDLMWRPTGPRVMAEILEWAGFAETRLVWWKNRAGQPGWGRLEIMGSKREGLLDALEGYRPAGTGFTYPT